MNRIRRVKKATVMCISFMVMTCMGMLLYGHVVSYAEESADGTLSQDGLWYYQVLDETAKTAMIVSMNRTVEIPVTGGVNERTLTVPAIVDGYSILKLGRDEVEFSEDNKEKKGAFQGLVGMTDDQEIGYEDRVNIVVVSEGITSIGAKCFFNAAISEVRLPDSVTTIHERAFNNCTKLTKVSFGNGITDIGDSAFLLCSSLENIQLPDSVINIGRKAFQECTSLKTVIIPDNVESIGEQAFAACSSLSSVVFGGSLTEIGRYAFVNCSALKSIVIPDTVTSLGYCAFANCTSVTSVIVGKGIKEITEGAFLGCTKLENVVIPEGVTGIGQGTFKNCRAIVTITLPGTLDSIGGAAFYNCENLSGIQLSDSVSMVGEEAFMACPKLTEIKLSKNIQSLGDDAFLTDYIWKNSTVEGESKRTEKIAEAEVLTIVLPEGIENIEDLGISVYTDAIIKVYEGDTTVIQYFIDNSVTNYITYTNADSNPLTEGGLGEGTSGDKQEGQPEIIGKDDNEGSGSNTNEKGIEGNDAGNTDEKSIAGADAGNTDGAGTLTGSDASTAGNAAVQKDRDVYVTGKTYNVGEYRYKILTKNTVSFSGCGNKKLTKVNIPSIVKLGSVSYKVTEISAGALKGYGRLKKLTIGKNVKKIGAKAFMNCKSLKTMSIKATKLASVGKKAFKGVKFGSKGVDITVPKGKKERYTKLIIKAR